MKTLPQLVSDVKYDYLRREINPAGNNILDILIKESFFDSDTPVVDICCGPFPHLGYRLAQKLEGGYVFFSDWDYTALGFHEVIYNWITSSEPEFSEKELPTTRWIHGDIRENAEVISAKSGIIHGVVPRKMSGEYLIIPDNEGKMKEALEEILSAKLRNLAIYVYEQQSAQLVGDSLVSIGIKFKDFNNVSSANFTPYKDGYLFVTCNL